MTLSDFELGNAERISLPDVRAYSLAELGCAGAKRNSGEIVNASSVSPKRAQRFSRGQIVTVTADPSDHEATGTFYKGEQVIIRVVYSQTDERGQAEMMGESMSRDRVGLLWGWEVQV